MNQLLEGLTEPQREAVTHIDGPLLILAGPGSGKTRVVTHRVAWMLHQGIPAEQILALTFTNKAADEMRSRVEQLAPGKPVWLGTFHRFCARMLRKYAPLVGLEENYTIYDTSDSRRAIRRVLELHHEDADGVNPDAIAKAISWAKNRLVTPETFEPKPGDPVDIVARKIYPAYQAYLSKANAADFDDLLLHVANLLRENPEVRRRLDDRYRYVMVDEYQDTNLAQYIIARALSIDNPNLAATGDPDQSIYSWRGANLGNILEFEKDYPDVSVVRLERNYRSTKRILSVADQLISHNVHRKEKTLYTENGDGKPVRLVFYQTQKDEADAIAAKIAAEIHSGRRRASDFAIFYRVNALSRAFEFSLRELGIPYQMVNGLEFFQRKEIKDVLAYLHLLNNPNDEVALLRVINTPARGIGKTTIGRLSEYAVRRGLTMLEAARAAREIKALSKRAATLVLKFVGIFDRLSEVIGEPLEEIVGNVLDLSGYRKHLEEAEGEEEMQRLENVEELLTVARDYDERGDSPGGLEGFLEETCLVNDTDAWEVDSDRVTLMTLHAAKGLEFPVVYMVAVEEGLLPHERSRDKPRELEEERRLMFVGITRARQELQISLSRYRNFRGRRKTVIPSHFLMNLPREEMDISEPTMGEYLDAEPSYVDDVDDVDDDTSFDFGANMEKDDVRRPKPANPMFPLAASVNLTTAAELAGGSEAASDVSTEDFHQGMLVRHRRHGLGRVVALSGSGTTRKATVDFNPTIGRKQFVLSEGELRPV